MSRLEYLKSQWEPINEEFQQSAAVQRIIQKTLTVDHYKWIMRQIFHHARENPQLQALASVRFRGAQRESVKRFLQHAVSEVGHDHLALNDLRTMGEDVTRIPFENPLPATSALLGFAFYQVENLNPVGYLGYLFHLEFTPTRNGGGYMAALADIGIPREAMTFLQDHATIDIGHNRLMERYVEDLIVTDEDMEAVVYAMRVTGRLYSEMLRGAIEQADSPRDWGMAFGERPSAPAQPAPMAAG